MKPFRIMGPFFFAFAFIFATGSALGFKFESPALHWTVHQINFVDGDLHLLIQYSEEMFVRSFWDIVWAERGIPTSQRQTFGVVSLPLDARNMRRRRSIEIYAHERSRTAHRGGFSDDGSILLRSFSRACVVRPEDAAEPVRYIAMNGMRPLHRVYTANGTYIFEHDGRLYRYSSAQNAWVRVGIIPANNVDFKETYRVDYGTDTRGWVDESLNLLCTWDTKGADETIVSGYALDDGAFLWRTSQPKEFSLMGAVKFQDEIILAFARRGGPLRLVASTGKMLIEMNAPKSFYLDPPLIPGMHTVITPFVKEGIAGFLLARLKYGTPSRNILYVWEVDIHGSSRNWEVPITLRRPGRNTPLIDLSERE